MWSSRSATGVHLPTTNFSLSCSASAEAVKGISFVNCVFRISGVLMHPSVVPELLDPWLPFLVLVVLLCWFFSLAHKMYGDMSVRQ
jgi:hypothetical protein